MLQYEEEISIMLFALGALWAMATILNLKRMQMEALREFVERSRCRIVNVEPGDVWDWLQCSGHVRVRLHKQNLGL
jgi:hypothetical protein